MAPSVEVHTETPQPESATTLRTVVDLVRRIMHADVASIVNYNATDNTITWKAASGFRAHTITEETPLVRPISGEIAQRHVYSNSLLILEDIGSRKEVPESDFPVHAAEGIRALAAVPFKPEQETRGALIAGYRSPHHFTDEEKRLLVDLSELASVALENSRLLTAVRVNETRLRLAQQAACIGAFEWDGKTGITTWSSELEAMHGLAPGAFAGTEPAWIELVHPDDRGHALDCVKQAFATREPTQGEWRILWPDGSVRWILSRFQVVADAQGNPQRVTGVNLDVTDRKQAETSLRDSEERYRELFENANDIVYTHDLAGNVTSINKAGELLAGYSRPELMKINMSDLLLPDSRQLADEMLVRKLAGEDRTKYEVEIKVRDGKVHTLEISSRLIFKDGEAVGVQGIARDITDRKHTEDALRASEERARRGQKIWEETFDATGEGILVYDKDERIVRCNARAAEMMERQPEAVLGLSFSEAFGHLFGKQAADYYLAESRQGSSAFEVRTEGGRLHLVSIFPVEHPDGDSLSVVTLNDVTRLSEMQEQLGRSRRLASVGQLAAGVAHEINNPLAAITTCAEATMRDLRQTAEIAALLESHQWNYYLEEIVRQALRCKEITRGLLDLTRQRRAQRVTCDLNLLVKQCAKVALQRAGSAIEFGIDLDNNVGQLATDGAMVRQILDNLLSNAIDALGEKEGKLTVATRRDGDRVAIEVSDTGCGIPVDSLARVFDPFFSMKGPGKGYGLGLAISSTLAESLGGAITVESKLEEGSRFSLWIPRRAPEE